MNRKSSTKGWASKQVAALAPEKFAETMHLRAPRWRRLCHLGAGCFFTLLGLSLGAHLAADGASLKQGELVFNTLFLLTILGSGIGLVASALRYRLTVAPEHLTLRQAFSSKTLARTDIADYRWVRNSKIGNRVYLYVHGKTFSSMCIVCRFEDDTMLWKWLDGIPVWKSWRLKHK